MLYHEYKTVSYDSFVVMIEFATYSFYTILFCIFKSQNSGQNLHTCMCTISQTFVMSDHRLLDVYIYI